MRKTRTAHTEEYSTEFSKPIKPSKAEPGHAAHVYIEFTSEDVDGIRGNLKPEISTRFELGCVSFNLEKEDFFKLADFINRAAKKLRDFK